MWLINFGISIIVGWFLKVILDNFDESKNVTHKRNNNKN